MSQSVTQGQLNTVINNLNSNIVNTGNNITNNLVGTANNLQSNLDGITNRYILPVNSLDDLLNIKFGHLKNKYKNLKIKMSAQHTSIITFLEKFLTFTGLELEIEQTDPQVPQKIINGDLNDINILETSFNLNYLLYKNDKLVEIPDELLNTQDYNKQIRETLPKQLSPYIKFIDSDTFYFLIKNGLYSDLNLQDKWSKDISLNPHNKPWNCPRTWEDVFDQSEFLKKNGRSGLRLNIAVDYEEENNDPDYANPDPWLGYFFLAYLSSSTKIKGTREWLFDENNNPLINSKSFKIAFETLYKRLGQNLFGVPWDGIKGDFDVWWGDFNSVVPSDYTFHQLPIVNNLNSVAYAGFFGWTVSVVKNKNQSELLTEACKNLSIFIASKEMNLVTLTSGIGFQATHNQNLQEPSKFFDVNEDYNVNNVISFLNTSMILNNSDNIAYDELLNGFSPFGITVKNDKGEYVSKPGYFHSIAKNLNKLNEKSSLYDESITTSNVLDKIAEEWKELYNSNE